MKTNKIQHYESALSDEKLAWYLYRSPLQMKRVYDAINNRESALGAIGLALSWPDPRTTWMARGQGR